MLDILAADAQEQKDLSSLVHKFQKAKPCC